MQLEEYKTCELLECLQDLARDTSVSVSTKQKLQLKGYKLFACLHDLASHTSLSAKQKLLVEEHKVKLRLTLAKNLSLTKQTKEDGINTV